MIDWMIGTGLAVSLLIALVLIVRRPFARMFGARAAYALWGLPFIRLFMPEVTVPRIFPQLSPAPAPENTFPTDIALTPEILAALQAEPTMISQITPYILPAIFGLWVLGAVTLFLYHWVRQASLMDRLNYESEAAHCLEREIHHAAEQVGLKRIPKVRISDEKIGPMVAGFIRPVVMLPDNFMTAFNARQRHYALMHEFMHIKRGDVWVALAWLGFRAVNWPNPLVHYAAKHFRSDQEAACDASVLSAMGDKKDDVTGYAETLIHAAKAAMTVNNPAGRASPGPSQLALTIHHPLKERLMILGTHKKTPHWKSRLAASVMIIGAATLSAPLIQADAHPEEELAGKAKTHTRKTVIKRHTDKDGAKSSEHFEINVDGDDVKAYRIEPSGKKVRVDIDDIDGIDASDIMVEKIEGLDGDMSAWISKDHKGRIVIHEDDGTTRLEFKSGSDFPKPPHPPRFSKNSENVFVLRSDTLEGLEGLEGLEALKSLKGLKGLEALKGLEGLERLEGLAGLEALKDLENFKGARTVRFFNKDGENVELKLRMTESRLAAARAMLEDTEVDEDDSREMAKAKRELEKARKALRAAERALKEAK